ncbi:3-isopropylmalate dehydratase [Myxococcota bacterium]|nr:3-isopropylmalate dehydratase [Myxococcota bacterium]
MQARVDWVIASELAWNGMARTYDALGRPPLPRPDRVYLAVDHVVRPDNLHEPKPRALVEASRRFATEAGLTHFYGPNQTILHARFFHALARPGDLIVGADSHTCSHGALGALALGLGGADVTAAMVTGDLWLEIPEVIRVGFEGRPPFGIDGKDVILATLGALGRNTVARGRVVEYDGPQLSLDDRFAIANMTAELGGVTALFPADEVTARALVGRGGLDLAATPRADPGAPYAATRTISLAGLAPQIARPHRPDAVGPITDWLGLPIDGAFIGACTTTREALVLAGLVLEAALAGGARPTSSGQRVMNPGDVETLARLEALGLAAVYRRAGFEIEAPGCSLCLGLSRAAARGEVWLTSQNRNYQDRIGVGARAFLASAASVAAAALSMRVIDPRPLLDALDQARFATLSREIAAPPTASFEPIPRPTPPPVLTPPVFTPPEPPPEPRPLAAPSCVTWIRGQVQRLGDHIDTDMIIPGTACHLTDPAALGAHCLEHAAPGFRARVQAGARIIVAGEGWGTGSSREQAAWALAGAGVSLIIARSFAFIHRRNLINEGIAHLVIEDEAFFTVAVEGVTLEVAFEAGRVHCEGRVYQAAPPSPRALALRAEGGLLGALRRRLAAQK